VHLSPPLRSSVPVEAPDATRAANAAPYSPAPAEGWRVLDTHQAMARGAPGATRMPPELARVQEVLRPGGLESGTQTHVHLDGLTRAQRYEQRTNMKDSLLAQEGVESCERVGTSESDT
jgi:hypothetical protein